jgi:Uma2 family endonuclease
VFEMVSIQEIKQAIRTLASIERASLLAWLHEEAGAITAVAEATPAYRSRLADRFLSVDEYLEFEQAAETRHEFLAGTLHSMGGSSESHQRLVGNVFSAFHAHLRGGPCTTFFSDFKLRLKSADDDLFYYPDVMVACRRARISEYYLEQPKLVIEVLSPSTEQIDRREKALNYRQIATLEEYVLIAQDRPHVEFQRRAEDWRLNVATSLDQAAEFRSIGLSLPLQQIYEEVPDISNDPITRYTAP